MGKKVVKSKGQYDIQTGARGLVRGMQWVWESAELYPTVHFDEYTKTAGGDRLTLSGDAQLANAEVDIKWLLDNYPKSKVPAVLVVFSFKGTAPMSVRLKDQLAKRFPSVSAAFPRPDVPRDPLKLRGPQADVEAAFELCLKEHPSRSIMKFLIRPASEIPPQDYALVKRHNLGLKVWRQNHPKCRAFIPNAAHEGIATVSGPANEIVRATRALADLYKDAREEAVEAFTMPTTPEELAKLEESLRQRLAEVKSREAEVTRREEAVKEWEDELKKQAVEMEVSKLRLAGTGSPKAANAARVSGAEDDDDVSDDDDEKPPKCDWTEYPDPETNRTFFYNIETKVSQWNKPDELIALEKWKVAKAQRKKEKREEAKVKRAKAKAEEERRVQKEEPRKTNGPPSMAVDSANANDGVAYEVDENEVQELLRNAGLMHLSSAFTNYKSLRDLLDIEFNQLVSLVPDQNDRKAVTEAVCACQQARAGAVDMLGADMQPPAHNLAPMVQQLQLVEHPAGLGFGMNTSLHRHMSNAVGIQFAAQPAQHPYAALPLQMVAGFGQQGAAVQMIPQILPGAPVVAAPAAAATPPAETPPASDAPAQDVNQQILQLHEALLRAQPGGAPLDVAAPAPAPAGGKKGKPIKEKKPKKTTMHVIDDAKPQGGGAVQELFKLMQQQQDGALPKSEPEKSGGVNVAEMLSSVGALGALGGATATATMTTTTKTGGKNGINLKDWLKGSSS